MLMTAHAESRFLLYWFSAWKCSLCGHAVHSRFLLWKQAIIGLDCRGQPLTCR